MRLSEFAKLIDGMTPEQRAAWRLVLTGNAGSEPKGQKEGLDFPLVDPFQQPNDDLAHAISLLRVAGNTLLQADRLNEQGTHDLFVVVDDVIQRLRPLHRYLDKLDYRGMGADYAKARREVIVGVQEDSE